MQEVTVYTKDNCPYCVAAKALLTQRGIPFKEIHISPDNDAEYKALQARSGMRTVPQIFHGDKLIGGFDSLSKLDSQDSLASLKA